ncbi:unnamed protein product [Lactuca saligna]|uniref:Uncharacterized protein n=1 Tax=Lactuca saligna TaxID=75948 RepID=A0AA35V277_LACSI|nr:unnamed protein product [Lactuca saligna]
MKQCIQGQTLRRSLLILKGTILQHLRLPLLQMQAELYLKERIILQASCFNSSNLPTVKETPVTLTKRKLSHRYMSSNHLPWKQIDMDLVLVLKPNIHQMILHEK